MAVSEREGGCACGAVRYRIEGDPIFVNNCHCRQCQQQTGSTSVVNAFFESDRITLLSGELAEHVATAGSGGPHIICRCSECGTALWSYYPGLGRIGAGLRVGTLDDSADMRPDAVVWVAERMPWVALPEGIPHFEAYYDFRELLAPEKIQRMDALIERRMAGEG